MHERSQVRRAHGLGPSSALKCQSSITSPWRFMSKFEGLIFYNDVPGRNLPQSTRSQCLPRPSIHGNPRINEILQRPRIHILQHDGDCQRLPAECFKERHNMRTLPFPAAPDGTLTSAAHALRVAILRKRFRLVQCLQLSNLPSSGRPKTRICLTATNVRVGTWRFMHHASSASAQFIQYYELILAAHSCKILSPCCLHYADSLISKPPPRNVPSASQSYDSLVSSRCFPALAPLLLLFFFFFFFVVIFPFPRRNADTDLGLRADQC